MKLATFKIHTEERVGAVVEDEVVDLCSAYAAMLRDDGESNPVLWARAAVPFRMIDFLGGGEASLDSAEEALEYAVENPGMRGVDGERLVLGLEEVRLMPPVPRPGKVYCAAVNFYDHATESIEDPEERESEIRRLRELNLDVPVIFQKPPDLVVGPCDPIIKPRASDRLDYECELAVVIGREGKYIDRGEAYEYIAGYMVFIDVSFRDQGFPSDVDFRMFKRDINWTKGKGMDNAAPTGPVILTKDEVPNPYKPPLRLITRVNGVTRQDGDLSTMIIDIPRIVEYLSSGTTLKPGDVIATGTVAGVARSWPDGFLKVGDVVECEIPSIGVLRHEVVPDPSGD
ncbi:MAG: fumarylacetoacetate hydrolase family protein [Candidatus Bathyarchaeia archaeon]